MLDLNTFRERVTEKALKEGYILEYRVRKLVSDIYAYKVSVEFIKCPIKFDWKIKGIVLTGDFRTSVALPAHIQRLYASESDRPRFTALHATKALQDLFLECPTTILTTKKVYCFCPPITLPIVDNVPHGKVVWPDMTEEWFLYGIRSDERHVVGELSINDILEEKNTEVRMRLIKRFGVDKLIAYGKPIDEEDGYTLLSFDDLFTTRARFLLMTNPSTGEKHLEGVNPAINTVRAAIDWRAQSVATSWKPSQLS